MSKALRLALLGILCTAVFIIFLKEPGINGYHTVMYGDMIYGKAYKPFVTRALLPAMVRSTTAAMPQAVKDGLRHAAADNGVLQPVFQRLGWEPALAPEYAAGCVFMFMFLLLFAAAFRQLTTALYQLQPPAADLLTGVALLCLPACFGTYSHIYDFASLFFFTAGMLLLVRRQFTLYLVVFAVSSFNKETTILLTLLAFLLFYRSGIFSQSEFRKFLLVQVLLYAAIRGGISLAYADNPGSPFELHLRHNTGLLHAYPFSQLFSFLAACFLLFFRWREKHPAARKAAFLALPVAGLAVFFGRLDELRAFYELLPAAVLLGAEGLLLLAGRPPRHAVGTAEKF